ncbi:unnamed protein product [Urochloa humidicola]
MRGAEAAAGAGSSSFQWPRLRGQRLLAVQPRPCSVADELPAAGYPVSGSGDREQQGLERRGKAADIGPVRAGGADPSRPPPSLPST